ncbi:hypothetical protein llap_1352 [Limosa lapponica baueri]|uniref:Uncharacterized protein n=1 Tax=Limosa lapponica baueri TaxID=1758121 RepID=A0A2I0UQM5_LIMLA|nr:hypothetical protein llap_1352 [Limosa lapponica baueri]
MAPARGYLRLAVMWDDTVQNGVHGDRDSGVRRNKVREWRTVIRKLGILVEEVVTVDEHLIVSPQISTELSICFVFLSCDLTVQQE